jgi:DNA-binding SARP family transcriptional activator/Tfp pilus assembly protein PilF
VGTYDGEPLVVSLFGPVRAWRGDVELDLGTPRQRAVFGLLAVRANRTVSRDELIDGIWGDDPPPSAVNAVHVYVAGLRRAVEPRRAHRAPGQILIASGSGYLLRLRPGRLDVEMFGQHVASGRESREREDLPAAIQALDAALALFQASPLAGIPGPWADIERIRLGELRMTAIEERIDAVLRLGRHAEAAAQLAGLVREHPLRERLHGQLMLALYRCGRQAEALAAFAGARRILIEQLGIEPGPELRRTHAQILATHADLDPTAAKPTAAADADAAAAKPTAEAAPAAEPAAAEAAPAPAEHRQRAVPAQLPADVPAFIGRTRELAELAAAVNAYPPNTDPANTDPANDDAPRTMVISAVSGTAGVGKTALVVHWAHRVRDSFPDGQLYVNLRGYDPDLPMTPDDALAGFLRALGMADGDIPADVDERATAYRSSLEGKRLLVVLDNAADVEQIHRLLPGSSSCVVLVTSRDSLAGLVARYGARRIDLDTLPAGDAVALLRTLIGERVDAEPDAAISLTEQCARLPLALRVAAEMAATSPFARLGDLVGELADGQQRLRLLDAGGDPRSEISNVLSWSYHHLPPAAAHSFRLLGLHPGPDLDLYAAAALTGLALDHVRPLLSLLTRAHLIQPVRHDRYSLHDLLSAYARSLAGEVQHATEERRAALTRLFDHYLTTAAAAMETLAPTEQNRRPHVAIPVLPATGPPVADPDQARAWLDAERAVLVAVTAQAGLQGWPGHATRLAATLSRYLVTGAHNTEAVSIHGHALRAARRTCDRGAEATALIDLGEVRWRLGHSSQEAARYERALAILRETGDRSGEARAHGNLGLIAWRQGVYGQAAVHYGQALAIFRDTGERAGEARALDNLGAICWRQGDYQQAAIHHQRALTIFTEIGDRTGQACALGNLATVCRRQGLLEQAIYHLEQSLSLSREIGNQACEAEALSDLGEIHRQQGRYQQAASEFEQALRLFRRIGHQANEAQALNGMGWLFLASGQPEHARTHHALALKLATHIGDKYQQGAAHDGLARAHKAVSDLGAARSHWQHALVLYTDLGVPESGEVLGHLALAGPPLSQGLQGKLRGR